jgi:tetratricopeptide (TPR) repeat protein
MLRNRKQPSRRKKVQADSTPAETPRAPDPNPNGPVGSPVPGQQTVATGDDVFALPIQRQPDHSDIFASFLDLASSPPDMTETTPSRPASRAGLKWPGRPLSYLQQVLIISIVATAAIAVYVAVQLVLARAGATKTPPSSVPAEEHPHTASAAAPPAPIEREPNEASVKAASKPVPPVEAMSLTVADKMYLAGDYENALQTYDRLFRRLPPSEEQQAMRDFLTFRMAMCYRNASDTTHADAAFRTLSLSRPPVIRALAKYHQSLALMERGRFLEAATRAYQCLALIEVVDYDKKWVSAVQQQCEFLVAEAFTRHLLSLRDADADLPATLWAKHPNIDPFLGLDEPQVKILLSAGSDRVDEAMLSPQIRPAAEAGRWTVACNGASVEELLARFASNAHLNIRWADVTAGPLNEETARRRPVYLYMAAATTEQILATGTGSVGLLAQMNGQEDVPISDPSNYTSLTDHTTLLINESLSLWNRFLVAAQDDQRLANAHFAIALLRAVQDRQDEAAAEYHLVATNYPKSPLAPHALLFSGKLRLALRDYPGAQKDLRQLADLYPDIALSDRALLYLADASTRVGATSDAIEIYRKVYNLGLSMESQTESALGAGRCLYEIGSYEDAAKWLSRYVDLSKGRNRPEFHATCLLLGKTYLELRRPQQAHAVLKTAMEGDLSRQEHVETVEALVKAYTQQGLMVEALGVLETTYTWQLSPEENMEMLLLRAQVLRSIGLTEKAITTLKDRGQSLTNMELKGKIALELAGCYTERGQYEQARATLSSLLPSLPAGPLAARVGRELAGVCLRMGQGDQAASICTQLLRNADAKEKEKLLAILAEARRKQSDYSGAMSVLLNGPDAAASDPNGEGQGKGGSAGKS